MHDSLRWTTPQTRIQREGICFTYYYSKKYPKRCKREKNERKIPLVLNIRLVTLEFYVFQLCILPEIMSFSRYLPILN